MGLGDLYVLSEGEKEEGRKERVRRCSNLGVRIWIGKVVKDMGFIGVT